MSSPAAPDTDRSAWLSDTALSALALDEQPFAAFPAIANGEAFADDVTAEQLTGIRQALITDDDLLLILGEDGAGKSTLLGQLAVDSGLRIQCFSVDGGPRFSTRNLFMGMLEAFKVEPSEDLGATLDELIPCLQAMVASNKLCVVVLDDAQAVPADELKTLLSGMLYVNSRDESLLRIALAAPAAFEDRIPDLVPEGADLPYSSLSLEPFDAARAGDYLAFRLARAGRDDELPFDEDELAELNERAGGRPAALHVLAAAALENVHGVPGTPAAASGVHVEATDARDGEIRPTHDEDLPPELRERFRAGTGLDGRVAKLALGTLAGLLIAGGLLLFRTGPEPGGNEARYRVVEQRKVETTRETERLRLLQERRAAERDGEEPAPPADDERVALAPVPDTSAPDPAANETAPDGPAAALPTPDATLDVPSGMDVTPEASGADDAPEASGPAVPDSTGELAPGPTPAETGAEEAPVPAADPVADVSTPTLEPTAEPETAEPEMAEPETAEPETAAPEPTAPETAEPEPADAVPEESVPVAGAEAPPADLDDVALLDADATPPSPVVSEPPATGVLESPNWVLVQTPGQYTVQMSASTERASIEEFLIQADLPAPNSIFSFERNGITWYALVHGLYPSIDEARDAVERLPPEALTDQPWIRAIERIQAVLRE